MLRLVASLVLLGAAAHCYTSWDDYAGIWTPVFFFRENVDRVRCDNFTINYHKTVSCKRNGVLSDIVVFQEMNNGWLENYTIIPTSNVYESKRALETIIEGDKECNNTLVVFRLLDDNYLYVYNVLADVLFARDVPSDMEVEHFVNKHKDLKNRFRQPACRERKMTFDIGSLSSNDILSETEEDNI